MNIERLNDMLNRYGEVCDQKMAAKILSVHPRTIFQMLEDGRLRRAGHRVDVRSLAEYIENPMQSNFTTRTVNSHSHVAQITREDLLAAARKGYWSKKENIASENKQI